MATEVAFAKTFLAILDTKPTKISADHVEDPRTYPASTPFTLPPHPSLRPFRKPSSSSRAAPAPGSTPASASTTSSTGTTTPGASSPSATSTGPTVTVHIRSPRNPTLSLTLPTPQPLATTSILDIKTFVSEETGIPVEKLKVLFNKKPVGDVKSLKEVLGGATVPENGEVELSLMVMGGQATYDSEEARAAREARQVAKAAAEGVKGGEAPEVPEVEMKEAETEAETGTTTGEAAAGPVAQGLSGVAVLDTEEFWDDLKGYLQQRIRDEKAAEEVLGKFRGAWGGRS
ncbi:cell-cycle control medial ring component [Neurospora tetraspora]|uniref:Cell-cycle control medial ring component n=1 Tax=Neurospora tetraspora TaxID=94610 RepID=A0AAE0JFF6_9PEZI|nr:cell-cycle control medial ring component [Neurospora tetraspora]